MKSVVRRQSGHLLASHLDERQVDVAAHQPQSVRAPQELQLVAEAGGTNSAAVWCRGMS